MSETLTVIGFVITLLLSIVGSVRWAVAKYIDVLRGDILRHIDSLSKRLDEQHIDNMSWRERYEERLRVLEKDYTRLAAQFEHYIRYEEWVVQITRLNIKLDKMNRKLKSNRSNLDGPN